MQEMIRSRRDQSRTANILYETPRVKKKHKKIEI